MSEPAAASESRLRPFVPKIASMFTLQNAPNLQASSF